MTRFAKHVFVCLNERTGSDARGSCAAKGAAAVLDALKGGAHAKGLKNIRIQRAGCLDLCEQGVAVVVYPEATWYGGVKPEDCTEILESHLVGGKPVERLRPGP